MRLSKRLAPGAALLALTSVLLAGCGSAADSDARAVAVRLLQAVADHDGATACDLLAPSTRSELEQSSGKPCDQAVLEEDLGRESDIAEVHVFGTMSQVRLSDGAIFLSEFDGDWLITAAACDPVPDHPYDCSVQGG